MNENDLNKRRKLNSGQAYKNNIKINDDSTERIRARQISGKRSSLVTTSINLTETPPRQLKRNSAPFFSPFKIQPIGKEILNEEELSKLYTETIRLAAAGKITQKNTWSINLIDYIDDLLSNEKKEADEKVTKSSTLFCKASNTLDASIKIYSSRVDSVHSYMYKVLGGLHSHRKTDENVSDDSDKSDISDQNDKNNKRKNKSKKLNRKKNDTLLSSDKIQTTYLRGKDFKYEIDPMFFKMASAFDESGSQGLLLNNLPVGDELQIIFDSDLPLEKDVKLIESAEINKNDLTNRNESFIQKESSTKKFKNNPDQPLKSQEIILKSVEYSNLISSILNNAKDKRLCPLLDAFDGEIRTIKNEIAKIRSNENNNRSENSDVSDVEQIIKTNDDQINRTSITSQQINENNSESEDDLYGDEIINGEDPIDRDEKNENNDENVTSQRVKSVIAFTNKPPDEDQRNEELLNQVFLNWTGPNFWQLSRTERKRKNLQSNKIVTDKPATLKNDLIDLKLLLTTDPSEFEKEPKKKSKKMYRTAKHKKMAKTRQKSKTNKQIAFNTLPTDMHLTADIFLRPFYRPHLRARLEVVKGSHNDPQDNPADNQNVCWYNYANPNDLRYCADYSNNKDGSNLFDNQVDSDGGDFDLGGSELSVNSVADYEENRFGKSTSNEGRLNSFDNFQIASQKNFNPGENDEDLGSFAFTKLSSQVDVRHLKKSLWRSINQLKKEEKPRVIEIVKEKGKSDEYDKDKGKSDQYRKDQEKLGEISFAQSVKSLKKNNPALANVSVQYCFVCLLHLANENGLEMKPNKKNKLGDFNIEMEK